MKIQGYSFLEILISLCILSFGLLGFVQAQLLALRTNQAAYLQSVAQTRLISLAETIQACASIKCSVANLGEQVATWNIDNAKLLPQGKGSLLKQNNYHLINIHWQSAENSHFSDHAEMLVSDF